jgi:hypothetical protein
MSAASKTGKIYNFQTLVTGNQELQRDLRKLRHIQSEGHVKVDTGTSSKMRLQIYHQLNICNEPEQGAERHGLMRQHEVAELLTLVNFEARYSTTTRSPQTDRQAATNDPTATQVLPSCSAIPSVGDHAAQLLSHPDID